MGKYGLIYDIETLSTNSLNAVAVSMAALAFNINRVERGEYTYSELLGMARFQKYNVEEQVKKYKREIEPETLQWWKDQGKEAINKLKPSSDDISIEESIKLLTTMIVEYDIEYVFTRNNTFDPVIIKSISNSTGIPMPYAWWKIRDTKSFIMGLTYEMNIRDDFMPAGVTEDEFVKHDPRHDIAIDVMRLQNILHAKMSD